MVVASVVTASTAASSEEPESLQPARPMLAAAMATGMRIRRMRCLAPLLVDERGRASGFRLLDSCFALQPTNVGDDLGNLWVADPGLRRHVPKVPVVFAYPSFYRQKERRVGMV